MVRAVGHCGHRMSSSYNEPCGRCRACIRRCWLSGVPRGALRLGVTGAPLVPRNVPIAEPVDPRQGATHGIDHLDDVAALDMVVEPLRVARADVQAAMAGVGVA